MLLFLTLILWNTHVVEATHGHSFLPENNLERPVVYGRSARGISSSEFWQALDVVEEAMKPVLKRLGQNVRVFGDWSSSVVNAYAYEAGYIYMYGGLARFEGMTLGGFMEVLCHEYGHTLRMAPLSDGGKLNLSAEGQADYFAGLKCLREVYRKNPRLASYEGLSQLPSWLVRQCDRNERSPVERQACKRSLADSQSLAEVLFQVSGDFGRLPSLSRRSSHRAPYTITYDYPSNQCRLDTFALGILCPSTKVQETFSGRYKVICGNHHYERPACWYKR